MIAGIIAGVVVAVYMATGVRFMITVDRARKDIDT